MVQAIFDLHWAWYPLLYLATGATLTGVFLGLLPKGSELHKIFSGYNSPPPAIIAIIWPGFVIWLTFWILFVGLDIALSKALEFDPKNLNPIHKFRQARQNKKTNDEAEDVVILGDPVPNWARWH